MSVPVVSVIAELDSRPFASVVRNDPVTPARSLSADSAGFKSAPSVSFVLVVLSRCAKGAWGMMMRRFRGCATSETSATVCMLVAMAASWPVIRMQCRRRRSWTHTEHSSAFRRYQERPRIVGHISLASFPQCATPHVGASISGNHEPAFRVGNPCVKQYISQVSQPLRSASSTALSHGSPVRMLFVNTKVRCTASSPVCQNILNIRCTSNG